MAGFLLESLKMVGAIGFEPTTSWSQTRRSTRLSYTPTKKPNAKTTRLWKECQRNLNNFFGHGFVPISACLDLRFYLTNHFPKFLYFHGYHFSREQQYPADCRCLSRRTCPS